MSAINDGGPAFPVTAELFDVVEVNYVKGERKHMGRNLTERNAAAILRMAIMRRGLDDRFFKIVPANTPLEDV
jgi:hypothetical protein